MKFDVNKLRVGRPLLLGFNNISNLNTVIIFPNREYRNVSGKWSFRNIIASSDTSASKTYNSTRVTYISEDYILLGGTILLRHEVQL